MFVSRCVVGEAMKGSTAASTSLHLPFDWSLISATPTLVVHLQSPCPASSWWYPAKSFLSWKTIVRVPNETNFIGAKSCNNTVPLQVTHSAWVKWKDDDLVGQTRSPGSTTLISRRCAKTSASVSTDAAPFWLWCHRRPADGVQRRV